MIRELVTFRMTRGEASTVYAALCLLRRHLEADFGTRTPGRDAKAFAAYEAMEARVEEVRRLESIVADEVGLMPVTLQAVAYQAGKLFDDFVRSVRRRIESERASANLPG